MRRTSIFIILSIIIVLSLSACASGDLAAQTVENYYQALVVGDTDRVTSLACADWEALAQMEVDSFQAVEASLDNFSCEEIGKDGDTALVSCTGQILMSYNGEAQSLDLSVQTYQVVEQGGDWLFCGYR